MIFCWNNLLFNGVVCDKDVGFKLIFVVLFFFWCFNLFEGKVDDIIKVFCWVDIGTKKYFVIGEIWCSFCRRKGFLGGLKLLFFFKIVDFWDRCVVFCLILELLIKIFLDVDVIVGIVNKVGVDCCFNFRYLLE